MHRSKLALTVLLVHLLMGLSCTRFSQDTRPNANSNMRTGSTTTGQDQAGYLMSSDSFILFLQWTKVGTNLNGQLQTFIIQGQNQRSYKSNTHPFTGVNDVGKISLNFTGSGWTDNLGGKTWTGTLQNNELTLVAPSPDGMLVPMKFKGATVEDYNQSVVVLKDQAQSTNQELEKQRAATAQQRAIIERQAAQLATQQRAIIERQQAVSDANQRVTNMIASLQNQTQALYGAAKIDEVIPQFKRSLLQMQGTVARLKDTAAETPFTASKLREVESILREVESNKRQVESDVRLMESAVRGVESYIRPVANGISSLRSDWEDLKRAAMNNPTNTPPVRFTEHDIEQEQKAAEVAIGKAKRITEGGLRQAKAFDGQAQRILDSARGFVRKLRVTD